MPQDDLFSAVSFARPDNERLDALKQALDPGGSGVLPFGDVVPGPAIASTLQRALTEMGGGCRLAAPPSLMFNVTAEDGNIVTRCGHDPLHEWHGTKRVK